MSDLEREIRETAGTEVDFTCDWCNQTYYVEDDVDEIEVRFGTQTSRIETVESKAIVPQIDQTAGYRPAGGRKSFEHRVEMLGRRIDEVNAIIKAIQSSDQFRVTAKRRVLKPEEADTFDGSIMREFNESDEISATLQATVETPDPPEPDATVCEYCRDFVEQ